MFLSEIQVKIILILISIFLKIKNFITNNLCGFQVSIRKKKSIKIIKEKYMAI